MTGNICFIKSDAFRGRLCRPLHIKKMQPIAHTVLIAGDLQVVLLGNQRETAEVHLVGESCIQQPGLRGNPGVRLLHLQSGVQSLAEQAIVIVEPYAVPIESQRGDRIQEAGGQSAQAAVSQGGFRLLIFDLSKRAAVGGQQSLYFFQQPQVNQVGPEQPPNQKFCGKVIQFALSLRMGHGPLQFSHCGGQGIHQFLIRTGIQINAAVRQKCLQIRLNAHICSPFLP